MDLFECSNCSKRLVTRKGIIRHLKKCETYSSSTKLYVCEFCQRKLLTASGLLKHKKKKHSVGERNKKTKLLKCQYCSSMFASTKGRVQHAKKKHPEYVAKLNERNTRKLYECITCKRSFTRKKYRAQHEQVCMNKFDSIPLGSSTPLIDQLPFEDVDASTISGLQDTVELTPSLQRYVRDRKSFLQLRTPDVDTPRKSRLNLKYGQQLVTECKKKINSLEQQVRRLHAQVKTYRDLILHMEENKIITERAAEIFLKSITK